MVDKLPLELTAIGIFCTTHRWVRARDSFPWFDSVTGYFAPELPCERQDILMGYSLPGFAPRLGRMYDIVELFGLRYNLRNSLVTPLWYEPQVGINISDIGKFAATILLHEV